MKRLVAGGYWVGLALAVTLTVPAALASQNNPQDFRFLVPAVLDVVWVTAFIFLTNWHIKGVFQGVSRLLYRVPLLLWGGLLAALVYGFCWWIVPGAPPERKHFYLWTALWLMALLLTGGLTRTHLREIGARLRASRWTNLMIVLTTIVLMTLGVEFVMRNFMTMSDSLGKSLLSKKWFKTYWGPISYKDYRDYPIDWDAPEGTQRIVVVGDSFAAGHGIQNIDDTFPHILGRMLGDGYTVNLVARAGWNTDDEFKDLIVYPLQPDIVILSYFVNDMIYVDSEAYGEWFNETFKAPPHEIAWLVSDFYLPNFLYYHIYLQHVQGASHGYDDTILAPYADPEKWAMHTEYLDAFVSWCQERDIRFIVLIWPALTAVEQSADAAQQVADYFTERGVTTINLTDDLRGRPAIDLVVNPFDSHPNIAAHTLAAEKLYAVLTH